MPDPALSPLHRELLRGLADGRRLTRCGSEAAWADECFHAGDNRDGHPQIDKAEVYRLEDLGLIGRNWSRAGAGEAAARAAEKEAGDA